MNYHPTEYHKQIGNKLFSHRPTGKDGEYRTKEFDIYINKMSPTERGKVNTHMARLHRRKNKSKSKALDRMKEVRNRVGKADSYIK